MINFFHKKGSRTRLTNLHNFTDLDVFILHWSVEEDGLVLQEIAATVPGSNSELDLDINKIKGKLKGAEYFFKISIQLKEDQSWAHVGHE